MPSRTLKDYTGTLPLTMKMFPEVPSPRSAIESGFAKEGDLSNILTGLEINPKDKKWYLFPTMIRGKEIDSYDDAKRRAFIGKNFGVYDSYEDAMKADKSIHDYFKDIRGYQNGGMAQPSSTGVHNNIDNLILQAELDKLAQTGSMRVDRTPEYIGGVDPVVENVALSPIMTLKSLGSVGRKILEKTGLRNPVSHYTTGKRASSILEEGRIEGRGEFPGKPFYGDSRKYLEKQLAKDKTGWLSETDIKFQEQFPKSPSVSITRDPMFLRRPHVHVGSDIGLIMDRDQLVRQGMKIQPFAEKGFQKTYQTLRELNPKFEFEERIRGYVPTKNIKLIDLIQLPKDLPDKSVDLFEILNAFNKSRIPIIKSPLVEERLRKIPIKDDETFENIYKLMQTPTYKFDPFKR